VQAAVEMVSAGVLLQALLEPQIQAGAVAVTVAALLQVVQLLVMQAAPAS